MIYLSFINDKYYVYTCILYIMYIIIILFHDQKWAFNNLFIQTFFFNLDIMFPYPKGTGYLLF